MVQSQLLKTVGRRLVTTACLVWMVNSIMESPASAQGPDVCSHSQCTCGYPELWVVNSRSAPLCNNLDAGFAKLKFDRYDAAQKIFHRETLESFLATEAERPTLLFVHGNSLNHENAMAACWKVYNRVKDCPGPKRVVFWSWRAEVVKKRPLIRPIKLARDNIRIKYVYAENQGYYLAKLVNMLSFAQPVTLSGHSFGGVSAITAAHYLGGGYLNGRTLDGGQPVERHNLRAVIVSGALDNDYVYPGCRYGEAFTPVELFYTTFNPRDATLRRWPNISPSGHEAMGYTGVCAARLGANAHKLLQHNLTEDVGKSHYMRPHLASDRMMRAICRTAFPCGQQHSMCGCAHCVASAASSSGPLGDVERAIAQLQLRRQAGASLLEQESVALLELDGQLELSPSTVQSSEVAATPRLQGQPAIQR